MLRRFTFPLCLAALGNLSLSAAAQTANEATSIIRSLAPIAGAPGPRVSVPQGPDRPPICGDTRIALDFEVYFPLNSADLTPLARQQLAELGRALASQDLQPYAYIVAGHTDATGQTEYNQRLSEQRAASVVRYLVGAFPILPDRLFAVGFGETRLKMPSVPNADINRRVEVLMIVPC